MLLNESVRLCERHAGLAICCCRLWGLGKFLDLYLARDDHLRAEAQAEAAAAAVQAAAPPPAQQQMQSDPAREIKQLLANILDAVTPGHPHQA